MLSRVIRTSVQSPSRDPSLPQTRPTGPPCFDCNAGNRPVPRHASAASGTVIRPLPVRGGVVDVIGLLSIFVSLFAIVDAPAVVPIFLALTRGFTQEEKRRVATKAVAVGLGVLLFFGLAGDFVFRVFGITIPAFRIAGGLLILKYAFDMLHGERPGQDANEAELRRAEAVRRESVGITPLGVPLLTGPGAIATMMVYVSTAPDDATRVGIFGAAILVFAFAYAILRGAPMVDRFLGPTGLMVTIRLLGLILAAVAVQFVADGVMGLVRQFQAGG